MLMIKHIIDMLQIIKNDPRNLSDNAKIALGRNKMPESIKEGIKLIRYKL